MINRTRRHKAIGAGPDEDQAAGPETVPADKAMPVARQQRRAAQTPRPREVPRPASRDGGWPPRPDLADGLAWLAMRRRGVALCPKRWRPDAATRWPPYRSLPARSSVRLLNQLGRTQARKGGGLLPNVRSKDAGMGGSARRMGLGPIRILRGRLEDDGYHTEEYRMLRGVMIQLTGGKPASMADPPPGRAVAGPSRQV